LAGCGDARTTEHVGAQNQALTTAVPRRIKALDYSAFKDVDTVHEGNCASGPVDAELKRRLIPPVAVATSVGHVRASGSTTPFKSELPGNMT